MSNHGAEGGQHPVAPEQTYREILDFLEEYGNSPAEIDILPSSYPIPSHQGSVVLRDGASLAIRKKDMIGPFTIARRLLFQAHKCPEPAKLSAGDNDKVLDATTIILLFDPEHLTAANYRKRYFLYRAAQCRYQAQSSVHDPVDDQLAFQLALRQELNLLAIITRSPLKRHSKSPTLWSHRFWIVSTFLALIAPSPLHCVDLWHSETSVALGAAERHFANYYTFNYLREFNRLLGPPGQDGTGDEYVENLVEGWCFQHPRDISGWSYLEFLSRRPLGEWSTRRSRAMHLIEEWKDKFSDWGRNKAVEWATKAMAEDMHALDRAKVQQ